MAIKATGTITILQRQYDAGRWTESKVTVKNLITDAFLAAITDALRGDITNVYEVTHIGLGTDATPTAGGMTELVNQVGSRYPVTRIDESNTSTIFAIGLDETQGNGSTYREIGLFTAASGGTMIGRALITPAIAKTSTIILSIYYNVTIQAA